MEPRIQKIIATIDSKIESLKGRGVTAKIIVLGKIDYYLLIGTFQKLGSIPGVTSTFYFHSSSSVDSDFKYQEIPIFFNTSINLPGDGSFVEVYGD